MSRSNPTEHLSNPSTRLFEWNGETGVVRYYDKDAKHNVDVKLPFTFIVLDRLGGVGGWHEASKSGIYSNEVKDTRQDVLVVKSFKGGVIAEGLWTTIKDRVKSEGGSFVVNCYVGFKDSDGTLAIGSVKFKGAGLGGWMDFEKNNRQAIYERAVTIDGFTEGKKGRVTFRIPTFKLSTISAETEAQAVALDKTVQRFLSAYLSRNKRDQVESSVVPAHHLSDEEVAATSGAPAVTDDDIPF